MFGSVDRSSIGASSVGASVSTSTSISKGGNSSFFFFFSNKATYSLIICCINDFNLVLIVFLL